MLTEAQSQAIVQFVKIEPRTVQEIAKHIGRSWVTADAYIEKIRSTTGMLRVKTFRKGTQGALKLVYYNHTEGMHADEVREHLYQQIRAGKFKHHFDFMEVFQFVPDKHKKAVLEEYTHKQSSVVKHIPLLRQAEREVMLFSGNLSIIHVVEGKEKLLDVIEELLKRKVQVRVLCRVNLGSQKSLGLLQPLLVKYPGLIEIRHAFQPLRGMVIDGKFARFKDEEQLAAYRPDELRANTRVFYDVYDEDWANWLQQVFWSMWRAGIDSRTRLKEIEKLSAS